MSGIENVYDWKVVGQNILKEGLLALGHRESPNARGANVRPATAGNSLPAGCHAHAEFEQQVKGGLNMRQHQTDGAEMVWIPDGQFTMGDGNEAHNQTVQGFWMYTKEVTNGQYRKFLQANPEWKADQIDRKLHDGDYLKHWQEKTSECSSDDQYPVVYVSWYAAKAYAEWAGGSLPTEAEWE